MSQIELKSASEDESDSLKILARLATEAGAPSIADASLALSERVTEGRFYVACVGQFKRGKSTLLNALVGEPILPTGVIPVTAVVTILRYGSHPGARVRFADGNWVEVDPSTLAEYVSEEQNPENLKGVLAVEVFVPNPLLNSGMCFVDTPGIGSVFSGNTEVTLAFVPHIDAALVVLGADPPISGDELALVEEVAKHVHNLIFLLNKADRLSEIELRQASAFTEQVLARRLARPIGPILQVSATERLESGGASRDWGSLYQTLQNLAEQSGRALVHAAQDRGMRLLIGRLLHELNEQRGALLRPIEESEHRVDLLKKCVAEARRSLAELSYLFEAEQDRLHKQFAERREQFLSQALSEARRELDTATARVPKKGVALREQAMIIAKEIAKSRLDAWLQKEQPLAEEAYRKISERFIDLANEFLTRLANSGEPGLAELPHEIEPEIGFRTRSRLYYHLEDPVMAADLSPLWRWLVDLVRQRASTLLAARRAAGSYIEDLLRRNSVLIVNDFDERVLESRRRLEAEIQDRLNEVSACAERALEHARSSHAAGAQAIEADLNRIDLLRREAEGLCTP